MTNTYAVNLSGGVRLVVVAGSVQSALEKAQQRIADYREIIMIEKLESDVIA